MGAEAHDVDGIGCFVAPYQQKIGADMAFHAA